MNGRMLAKKILRIRYYWDIMETNCVDYVKSCHDCQAHANLNHVPPSVLYSMISPWPFSVWGIDVIERIAPKASNRHEYILVAIDYFTKWVEVAFYYVLKANHVAQFLENNIICQFGVPQERSFLIMVPILKVKSKGSWKNMALSITSLHHIDYKLIGL